MYCNLYAFQDTNNMLPKIYRQLQDKALITTQDAGIAVGNYNSAKRELNHLVKQGYLQRIKRGLYAVVPIEFIGKKYQPDKFVVAGRVVRPYAISHHSALELHGLAQSVFNRVYISSPERILPFSCQDIEYKGVIAKDLFGITNIVREGYVISVTDIERTLLDCLRQPNLAGGVDELFRSLEGLQGTDLLSALYKYIIAHNELPKINKFRADWDTRRLEIDQLVANDLIRQEQERYLLSITGLFYCSEPQSADDIKTAETIFQYLRVKYKENPEEFHGYEDIAHSVGSGPEQIKRILAILGTAHIFGSLNRSNGFVEKVSLSEGILDYKDFNELLYAKIELLSKKEKSFNKISIDAVRLLEYLEKFNDKFLYAKTGFLLKLFAERWKIQPEVLDAVRKKTGSSRYYFPRGLKRGSGGFVHEWNLIVPEYLLSRYKKGF